MSATPDPATVFAKAIQEHQDVIGQIAAQQGVLEAIAVAMAAAIRSGGKVLWGGNGGSAADAQHMAAEMVGRFRRERKALASIALTTDTSILTAIGNDYGYEQVFSRQVEALGNAGDVLIGLSTSGNSQNVVAALGLARYNGLTTVGFTGLGGGKMAGVSDHLFAVPSKDTARIQEAHCLACHMLCDWVEIDWLHAKAEENQAAPEACTN